MNKIIGLGIDQGILSCGYAVVEMDIETQDIQVITYDTIHTESSEQMEKRMYLINKKIESLIQENVPQALGGEKLFHNKPMSGGKNFARNKSSSIMETNMVTGILMVLAGKYELFIKTFVPGTVKKQVTGSGTAKKEDVEKAVSIYMNKAHDKKEKITEHDADAVAIAITVVKEYAEYLLNPLAPSKTKKKKKGRRRKVVKSDYFIETRVGEKLQRNKKRIISNEFEIMGTVSQLFIHRHDK